MVKGALLRLPGYRSDWSFSEQLNWHMLRGTRPGGSTDPAILAEDQWTIKSLAAAIAMSMNTPDEKSVTRVARNISNWKRAESSPRSIFHLEKVLFGDDRALIKLFSVSLRDSFLKDNREAAVPPGSALDHTASMTLEGEPAVVESTHTDDEVVGVESRDEGRGANAERAARKLDDVSELFRENENLLVRRVAAWSFVVEAFMRESDVCGAERAAKEIDRVPESFKVTAEFQLRRAIAWCLVAEVCLRNFDSKRAELAAKKIDDAPDSYKASADFQLRHVVAWSFVAEAYARDLDAENAKRAAKEIDKVADTFKGRDDFLLRRVIAWAFVAEAYGRSFDPVNAENAAEEVEKVPDAFKAGEEFQLRRATSWAFVAEAYGRRG